MLSPAVKTVASGWASRSSAVASSFVPSQRAMLPAPMSIAGDWVRADWAAAGATGGGTGGWTAAVGTRSWSHVASRSSARLRAETRDLRSREPMLSARGRRRDSAASRYRGGRSVPHDASRPPYRGDYPVERWRDIGRAIETRYIF